jgi:hypothetical protein
MAMKMGEVVTTGDEDDHILPSSSLYDDGEMEYSMNQKRKYRKLATQNLASNRK